MSIEKQGDTVASNLKGLVLLSLFLLPVLVYWPTAVEIFAIWMRSDTFAHGVIVFPLAVYLLFERRDRITSLPVKPSGSGLLALIMICAAWYLASLAGMAVMQQLLLGMMMSATVVMVLGVSIARKLAFPLLFVLFSVPVGEFLIRPLMSWTAEFTILALKVTGIPVFREGMFFKIPSGNFEVAKACSGIRYLIASVALGSLYANMFLVSRWRQLLFVGVAIVLPIVANGLRAYGIVMIAHLSDMKLAVGVDHIVYGWLFFGVVMFLMFSFGWRLKAGEAEQAPEPEPGGPVTTAGPAWGWRGIAIAAALALVIMVTPRILQLVSTERAYSVTTAAALFPVTEGGWEGPLTPEERSPAPSFEGAVTSGRAQYRNGADAVTVFIATYDAKNTATEMVSWKNQFYPEPWKVVRVENYETRLNGRQVTVREALISLRGRRQLVWHWYETDSLIAGGDVPGKIAETLAALPFRNDRPRAVAVFTASNDEVRRSRELLDGFLREAYAGLERCLEDRHEADAGMEGAQSGDCQGITVH